MIFFFLAITCLIALVCFVFYTCMWEPKKVKEWQAQMFRKQGYKVLEFPFSFFDPPVMKVYNKKNNTNDSLAYVKENYPKYDVVVMNFANRVIVDIVNPELVKHFLANDKIMIYPKSRDFVSVMERAIGKGIPFSEGQTWKRKRKIISEVFNFEFVASLAPRIGQICDESLDRLQNAYKTDDPSAFKYHVLEYTIDMAANVMLECFFGNKFDKEQIQGQHVSLFINRLTNDMALQPESWFYPLFGVKFLNLGLREMDRDINNRIKIYKSWAKEKVNEQVRRAQAKFSADKNQLLEPTNLIDAIMRSIICSNGESVYTEDDIFEEFSTFFVAGVDTSAHFLMMMIYYVSLDKEIEQKLRQQIDKYMKEEDYSTKNLKNMTYIDCIQKETSRHYGPVNGIFSRVAQQDNFIDKVPIKKGTNVLYQPLGSHYNDKYYSDPFKFRPERWISECDDVPTYAVGGFSGGARTCLGKHFAKMETKIALIKFFKRYSRVELPTSNIKMISEFFYRPKDFKTQLFL